MPSQPEQLQKALQNPFAQPNKAVKNMNDRPALSNELDAAIFKEFYYLKEELIDFCKQNGLQTAGGKIDLTNRIYHYLDTGEKLFVQTTRKPASDIGLLTENTIIENNFVCTEKHRVFFQQAIGKGFTFTVTFQKWLKTHAGETYKNAIEAYNQIAEAKKKQKTDIDKQFEYNTYIRDFFADNQGKSLNDAIQCWKYKKGLPGHNQYEKSDLIASAQGGE